MLDLSAASGKRIPVPTLNYPGTGSTIAFGHDNSLYVGGGFVDFRGPFVSGALGPATFIARILRDGTLDSSFSTGGVLIRTGFQATDTATDTIAILPSGRIVTSDVYYIYCGVVCPPIPDAGRIAQWLLPSGVPTARIEDALLMRTDKYHDSITATGVFQDGGIVAFNRRFGVGISAGAISVNAFSASGRRDTTFERNAVEGPTCPIGSGIWKLIAGVDKQDRLVVIVSGPNNHSGTVFTTCVTRLLRNGSRDPNFGVDGEVVFKDALSSAVQPEKIAFSAEGGIRIALLSAGGTPSKIGQIRLTAKGLPDGRFADGAITTFTPPLVAIRSIEPLLNGDTVMMGFIASPDQSAIWGSAIARTSGNIRDIRFGPNGDGITPLVHPDLPSRIWAPPLAVSEQDGSIFALADGGTKLIKLQGSPTPTLATARYDGLWWRSPAGSEAGWGVNLTHQGDILFATWFTYDLDGSPTWLVMPKGERVGNGKYSGALYRTTGPAYTQTTFNTALVTTTEVGTATFDFNDPNNGLFTYRVNGISQSKPIIRQEFGALSVCAPKILPGVLANYQGLWWNAPENSEPGWGINLTHQSDTLFATWFTYDATGKGVWLAMSNGERTPAATPTYRGTLYRTTGPAFNAIPWRTSDVTVAPVGEATFSFANADTAQFAFTVNGFSAVKKLTRQIFARPISDCQ